MNSVLWGLQRILTWGLSTGTNWSGSLAVQVAQLTQEGRLLPQASRSVPALRAPSAYSVRPGLYR